MSAIALALPPAAGGAAERGTGDLVEPISPELVLVDPELAERARRDLPVRREPTPLARRSRIAAPDAPALASEPAAKAPAASWPVYRSFAAAAILFVALVGLGALAADLPFFSDSDEARLGVSIEPTPTTHPVTHQGSEHASHGTTASAKAPARPVRRAPVARVHARTFAWAVRAGAVAYRIRFFRNGRPIFEATTSGRRLTVPAMWTYQGRRLALTPGLYRWTVHAATSGDPSRFDEPVVDAALVIPREQQ